MILDALLCDTSTLNQPDDLTLSETDEASEVRLIHSLKRRLERMREPQVFHRITPRPEVKVEFPDPEPAGELTTSDVEKRAQRHRNFDRDLHRRIAKRMRPDGLSPHAPSAPLPPGTHKSHANLRPTDFPGAPDLPTSPPTGEEPIHTRTPTQSTPAPFAPPATPVGDPLAARARNRLKRKKP